MTRLATKLCQPVDAASLNAFRFAFGLLLLTDAGRFIAHDWVAEHYLKPGFLFSYAGFGWATPWPGDGLYWHFSAIAALSVAVALGWMYRIAIVALFIAFGYVFLLDKTSYLNQYYLMLCVAFVLVFVPAERGWSLDESRRSGVLRQQVPRWAIVAPCLLFEIVLLHAGLVKINDDWLHGQPLALWFAESTYAAWSLTWLTAQGVATAASYAVLLLHLVGAPLLLFRRTRIWAFLAYAVFHLANSLWLQIGIFPWITVAGTTLFLAPDWPRRVARRLGFDDNPASDKRAAAGASAAAISLVGTTAIRMPVQVYVLGGFLLFQALFPFRAAFADGSVAWTGEAEFFSWRMKLDDKRANAVFFVRDPETGQQWTVEPENDLTARQVLVMSPRPALILQYAHHLADTWAIREGVRNVEVRARVTSALNGRPPALLVDPDRDLVRIRDPWKDPDWILPLRGRVAGTADSQGTTR